MEGKKRMILLLQSPDDLEDIGEMASKETRA
jgi:hypothetical protein